MLGSEMPVAPAKEWPVVDGEIAKDDCKDFTDAERGDGKIIAAQPQCGNAAGIDPRLSRQPVCPPMNRA